MSLLTYLLSIDLRDYKSNNIPMTEIKTDIIEANRDSTDSFVREENWYKRYVTGWNCTDCYDCYVRYCNDNGFKVKKSKTFGADMKKYCDRKQRRKENGREWFYKFTDEYEVKFKPIDDEDDLLDVIDE